MTGPESYAVRAHVQAWQITGENLDQVAAWCGGEVWASERAVDLPALDGRTTWAEVGDWIVQGLTGRFFAVDDRGFREHYYRQDPPAPVVRGCLTGEPLNVTVRGSRP